MKARIYMDKIDTMDEGNQCLLGLIKTAEDDTEVSDVQYYCIKSKAVRKFYLGY
jgi:hypothetical protein